MKTSRFEAGEAEGFANAIEDLGVSMLDMLWVSESGHAMLLREGDYPPLRGSFSSSERTVFSTREEACLITAPILACVCPSPTPPPAQL